MPRKKSKSKRTFNFPLLLASTLLAALFIFLYSRFRPQQVVGIYLIENTALSPGYVKLSGYITRDTPLSEPGHYLLIISDSLYVQLDIDDLSDLIGQDVTVTGNLTLSEDYNTPPILFVDSITTSEL